MGNDWTMEKFSSNVKPLLPWQQLVVKILNSKKIASNNNENAIDFTSGFSIVIVMKVSNLRSLRRL